MNLAIAWCVCSSLAVAQVADQKSVPKAVLLSVAIPGAGQVYAQKSSESWIKGMLFAGAEIAIWTVFLAKRSDGRKFEKKYEGYADANWSADTYVAFLEQTNGLPVGYLGREATGIDLALLHDAETDWARQSGAAEHHLYEQGRQQYYEMIYKYPEQFGQGWSDANPGLIDPDNGLSGYTPANLTDAMLYYRSVRNKSNSAFATARTMTGLMIANRFFSAIDAAWTTRRRNREHRVSFGFRLTPAWSDRGLEVMPGLTATF